MVKCNISTIIPTIIITSIPIWSNVDNLTLVSFRKKSIFYREWFLIFPEFAYVVGHVHTSLEINDYIYVYIVRVLFCFVFIMMVSSKN